MTEEKTSNSKKRKTSCNDKHRKEFHFIEVVMDDDTKAFCKICPPKFLISHVGRSDIILHNDTKKYQASVQAASSSKKVNEFFKT